MANEVTKPIYQGTELKFLLDIESEGFVMADDDFYIVIKNMKNEKTIRKEEMLVAEEDKYLFTVDTAELGTGDYWLMVVAYVADSDFDDGLRTEVQKLKLCTVTS